MLHFYSGVRCHMSGAWCLVSGVRFHESGVGCHMSCLTYQASNIKCCVLPVTCLMSPPTATTTDPPHHAFREVSTLIDWSKKNILIFHYLVSHQVKESEIGCQK